MRGRIPDLDEQLDRLERACPAPAARCLSFLRRPGLFWLRMPVGILLVIGGLLSFLPVLGLWMLPLGLIFIALDVPFLRAPVAHAIAWGEGKTKAIMAWWHGEATRARRNF